MKTAIQKTSLSAYRTEIEGTLGERQSEVLAALITRNGMTDKELARELGREINTITPRRNELVALGLVREHCKRPCGITGRTALCWERMPENGKLF